MSATKLEGLGIDEVSGVDAPANGMPGWMVIKSEDGAVAAAEAQMATLYGALGQAQVLADAPDAVRKAAEDLSIYIEKELGAEDDEPAPSLIDKMRSAFRRRAEDSEPTAKAKGKTDNDGAADGDDEDGDEDDEGASVSKSEPAPAAPALDEDTVLKALEQGVSQMLEPVAEDMEVIKEALVRVLDRVEQLEDNAVGSSQAYGQESDAVEKHAPTLRDAIMSAAAGNRVTIS